MGYSVTRGSFLSSDKKTEIKYKVYTPDIVPHAIFQISHGMCDYIGRYEACGLVAALCDAGFVVCGNDHIGHGESAATDSDFGYIENYMNLVDDLHILNGIMRQKYKNLPYILMGHSMGSFVARKYAATYPQSIDGAIFCGTSGGDQPLGAAIFVSSALAFLRGKRYRSNFVKNTGFKGYNDRFADEGSEVSWVTSDSAAREEYLADKYCTFTFTVSGYRELSKMIKDVCSPEWYEAIPTALPVFLIAGDKDPVGNFGEGVKKVYEGLLDRELNELKLKLYEGGRHEIFNESEKNEVFADIIDWCDAVASGVVDCNKLDM